jgi:hypothetical protein
MHGVFICRNRFVTIFGARRRLGFSRCLGRCSDSRWICLQLLFWQVFILVDKKPASEPLSVLVENREFIEDVLTLLKTAPHQSFAAASGSFDGDAARTAAVLEYLRELGVDWAKRLLDDSTLPALEQSLFPRL